MVHRDIKPGNLMISLRGDRPVVKVLDFGLAKVSVESMVFDVRQAEVNPPGGLAGSLTDTGQVLGTPEFIAPEQITDSQKADIRADIYSLGCTLYYLLRGGPPFDAKTLYDVIQAHRSIDAKPLNIVRPEVPPARSALVAKMMAKEPARRFQTPIEVARALEPFFTKRAIPSSHGTKTAVSRSTHEPPDEMINVPDVVAACENGPVAQSLGTGRFATRAVAGALMLVGAIGALGVATYRGEHRPGTPPQPAGTTPVGRGRDPNTGTKS